MKRKRRYQRNKKLGIKNNYNKEIHEICIYKGASIEFLFNLLNKHNIIYYLEDQNDDYFTLNISGKDINKIYDLLLNELTGEGMTKEINNDGITKTYINDYGLKIDNLIGVFALIKTEKDELEKQENKIYRSRKIIKYNNPTKQIAEKAYKVLTAFALY